MKVFVTGGSGFLGRSVIQALSEKIPQVDVLAPSRGELDLMNRDKVISYIEKNRPTHVYHLAAEVFGVFGHLHSPMSSLSSISLIDSNLFYALSFNPPKWIFYASTVAAYGYPYLNLPLREEDCFIGEPHQSEYGYAKAKRQGLTYLQILQNSYKTEYVYALLTNLFGQGDPDRNDKGHVIAGLIKKAIEAKSGKSPFIVRGDPNATRDFIEVNWAARILVELLEIPGRVLNIASGQELSIKLISEKIAKEFGIESRIQYDGVSRGVLNRFCSNSKLQTFIDVPEEDSLEKIIQLAFLEANSK